jgi:hypothetical protein
MIASIRHQSRVAEFTPPRVDGLATEMGDGKAQRPQSDFTTLEIDAEMLDRPH